MEGKGVPKKGRPCQEPGKGKTFPIKIYKVLEAPAEDEPLEKPTNVKSRNSCIGNIVGVLGSTRPSGGFQEFHHLLLELRLDDGRVQRDLQAKLDDKEPCQKSSKDRHRIIRVLHEAMIEHTMYPTNAEYVQVAKELIVKYPFLKDLEGNGYLCDEVDQMHSSTVSLSRRFKDGFTTIVPKVLQLVQRNAPLAKIYKEAREEMLAEDLPDSDFRAALILLPHIFKEKVESFITLGESDADTPYPTIQLVETDWKMAFSKRLQVIVKVDGVEVCRGTGVEEGTLAAFSAYYVFNLAYPPYMKNTLTFLQHAIAKIIEVGGKPLPITVTRIINILC
ncbi:hypothetical protein DPEC_G00238140 [Dallia pectoralis]|uniref:Uncharacterized protein n=1 Tax=Dallia pectoralis TaxID=75939 RepID=A0ACC2FYS0_DALPE|nr:hypothetical protein DPEC_G00238140 [Dallia pectoralis]